MTTLKGSAEFKRRLEAVRLSFKPIGKKWAEGTVDAAKPRVPYRTGRLRQSIRVKSATKRKAVVGAHYTAFFVDAGSVAHTIEAKNRPMLVFKGRNGTIFARKVNHPRIAPRPFRARAAHESLRQHPMAETLIKSWNDAA